MFLSLLEATLKKEKMIYHWSSLYNLPAITHKARSIYFISKWLPANHNDVLIYKIIYCTWITFISELKHQHPGLNYAFFDKTLLIKIFNYLVVPICLVTLASTRSHKYYWSFPPWEALKSLCIHYTDWFLLSAVRFKTSIV